jgi:HEAT repeat protein
VTELRFRDLRADTLRAPSVAEIELLGCVLAERAFADVAIRRASITGCYLPAGEAPLRMELRPRLTGSHLRGVAAGEQLDAAWPSPVADAAERLVTGDNAERVEGAVALGELGHPDAAGLLGFALGDREWDVRLAALRSLDRLRGEAFPYADTELLERIALRLGDRQAFVRDEAWDMLARLDDPAFLARVALNALRSEDPAEIVDGATALASLVDWPETTAAARAVLPRAPFDALADHADPRVRAAAIGLLGGLDDAGYAAFVAAALDDPDPAVRASALAALRALGDRAAAPAAARLLEDPDEDVRIEALTTVTDLDPAGSADALDRARVDPSRRMREWADALSASRPPS